MSGVDLQAVCDAIVTLLEKEKPDDEFDYSAYSWPPLARDLPCVWVAPDYSQDYFNPFPTLGDTYSDAADMFVTIELAIPPADSDSLGISLNSYLSLGTGQGSSIVGVLMSDQTLDGTVERIVPGAWRVQDPGDDGPPVRASLPVAIYLRKS